MGALDAVGPQDVLPIGPVLPTSGDETSLFEKDDAKYIEWLDSKPANSVVYVSFGSLALLGLQESRRPYLLVLRKDNKATLPEAEAEMGGGLKNGIVVEWCDQVQVLSHEAVGCFVRLYSPDRLFHFLSHLLF